MGRHLTALLQLRELSCVKSPAPAKVAKFTRFLDFPSGGKPGRRVDAADTVCFECSVRSRKWLICDDQYAVIDGREGVAGALVRRLSLFSRLTVDERRAIELAAMARTRRVGARHRIARQGDKPRYVSIVLEGWACGYKHGRDGTRQILGLYLPGEHCDSSIYILDRLDHSLEAITDVTVGEISPADFRRLMERSTTIAEALWWEELVSSAIKREWIYSLTQRSAIERIAHLICELYLRLNSIGAADDHQMPFPLTQTDIAETTGLSPVHVNRMIQELRRLQLISIEQRELHLLDARALADLAAFDPEYLHLSQRPVHE